MSMAVLSCYLSNYLPRAREITRSRESKVSAPAGRDGCRMAAVFDVKKEIPVTKQPPCGIRVLRGHKSSSHVPVGGHPNVRFSMTQYRTICATLFLAALALHTLGCGSSNMNTNRVLQSM